uniref:RING-type domain-containing protein n=1 Tax=Seriola dumerili TaxID=41447 RepID=A0A3B4UP82_SERDU
RAVGTSCNIVMSQQTIRHPQPSPQEQFQCSICLDTYKNPTSIPCGHNFCLECIKLFWDTKPKPECPLCKEIFKIRPELRINKGLRDITEFLRELRKETDELQKRRSKLQYLVNIEDPLHILQVSPAHRILLFSRYLSVLTFPETSFATVGKTQNKICHCPVQRFIIQDG